ncbi:MAG: hypothetical protein NTV39_00585 [Candidatus Saccharibacteria bacterium]|nr:hypothetical protein [Candidatus Saccharibacteria bacterium]
MSLIDKVSTYSDELRADLSDKKGVYKVELLIAERKAFLSKKKLRYIAKFRINDDAKELKFTEMLAESGSGLSSSSGDFDGGMSTGFGFKTESYKTGGGGREGSIEEQSKLFGKDYSYNFDYKAVRSKFEDLAKSEGYSFKYQITPIGL